MTTVPPPSSPLPQMPAAPPAAAGVLILQPPPAVSALPAGIVLEGLVVASSPDSAPGKTIVTIRTPEGQVAIRLAAALPDGARVALEILRTTAQTVQQESVPAI